MQESSAQESSAQAGTRPSRPDGLPEQVGPPAFAISSLLPHQVADAEAWALPVLPADPGEVPDTDAPDRDPDDRPTPLLGPGGAEAADALGTDLLGALESSRSTGRAGEVTVVPVAPGNGSAVRVVLLVGVGSARPVDLRRAGAATARSLKDRAGVASSVAAVAGPDGLEAFVVGTVLGSFGFHWRSGGPRERPVRRVVLAGLAGDEGEGTGEDDDALARALAVARAGWFSRHLSSVPSNLKNPRWLAERAGEVAADHGLDLEVWDERRLEEDGFGGILGVGQASATPPRLIRLDYTPDGATRRTPRVVLVGKGITFDSGGLSIKPAEGMVSMKRDMTGGAVVLATMAALRDVGCPVAVTGLVAAAENAVSGNALRPGDVLRHYGGRTTEVTNTDAEGRLVMADALAYAVAELEPAALLDVATLTGAMKVALGQSTGGFFTNHDALGAALAEAGRLAGEPLWRMPLVRDYADGLRSEVADSDNARPGMPGAVTAALFLEAFVGEVPWVHLDIASVGDAPKDHFEWTQGPTGFGARLLLAWLGSEDPLAALAR